MRTPIKPLPEAVVRWTRRARRLRWLDGVAAWLLLWVVAAFLPGSLDVADRAVLAALAVAALALAPPLRRRWRPVSTCVALIVSRPLRPGDRAWCVRPGDAELVLVTARRGLRVVIAGAPGPTEGIPVSRTRVILLPADTV